MTVFFLLHKERSSSKSSIIQLTVEEPKMNSNGVSIVNLYKFIENHDNIDS